MGILFKNCRLIEADAQNSSPGDIKAGGMFVATDGKKISYVGAFRPDGNFEREIDCRGNLLTSGFYNLHCHAAMTMFRGYGENLPLDEWLNTRIFPAEERLDAEKVKYASYMAIAEMIQNGIVSFSDSYFFCESTAEAVISSGIKANLSRGMSSFDEGARANAGDRRFSEFLNLYNEYDGAADGRLKVDMCIHSEYTNVESYIRDLADFSARNGLIIQVHMSETKKEHTECMKRRNGRTPAAFLRDCGVFESMALCAHCVWVTDDDMEIMAQNGAFAIHNPCSNLKLGSGIMPLHKFVERKIPVAIGTDGASSNNSLDILREMYTASLLSKGITGNAMAAPPGFCIEMATVNGAAAQRREKHGRIKEGYAADIILVDLDTPGNIPCYDPEYALLYSVHASDVMLTMADGVVLYENKEFKTIDIEKVKDGFRRVCDY